MASSSQHRSDELLQRIHDKLPEFLDYYQRTLDENLREILIAIKDEPIWEANVNFVNLILRYRDSIHALQNFLQIIDTLKDEIHHLPEEQIDTKQKLLGMLSFAYFMKFSVYKSDHDKKLAKDAALSVSPTLEEIKEPHALFVLGALGKPDLMQQAIKMEFPYAIYRVYLGFTQSHLYRPLDALSKAAELGLNLAYHERALTTQEDQYTRYEDLLKSAETSPSGLGPLGFSIFFGDFFKKDEALGKRLVQTAINFGESTSLFYMAVIYQHQSEIDTLRLEIKENIEQAMLLIRECGYNVDQIEILKLVDKIYKEHKTNPFIVFHAALRDLDNKEYKANFVDLAEKHPNKFFELANANPADKAGITLLLKSSLALKAFEKRFNQVSQVNQSRVIDHFLFAHFPAIQNSDKHFDRELKDMPEVKTPRTKSTR